MERDGSGVSVLVGLDGFVVCAPLPGDASGEWWLAVQTTDDPGLVPTPRRAGCRPWPEAGGGP
jgi:hypothetical protein